MAPDGAGRIHALDPGGSWIRREGRFRQMSFGPFGEAWAVSADFRIFRGSPG